MAPVSLPCRSVFDLPEGVIYLDGNSLGPLPKSARTRLAQTVDQEWGQLLIRGWTQAGWIDLPQTVGNKIGALIGAEPDTVMVCDSTSVNLFKVLSAALTLNSGRKTVLSDRGIFRLISTLHRGWFMAGGRP